LTAREWRSTSANAPAWYDDLVQSLFTFKFWDFVDAPRRPYSPDLPTNLYVGLYQEIYEGTYGSRPAYALIGWPLFFVQDQDIMLQLYLVRLNTILMSVGVVYFSYLITRLIFPTDPFLFLGVPLLILFNPQHTHLLSTVNNGNLAELLATAALYFLVRGIIKGFTWGGGIGIVLLSVAAMWTKATAYFLPFAIGSIGLFYLWRYKNHWRWLVPSFVLIAGSTFFFMPARLKQLIIWAWWGVRAGNFYLDPIVPIDLFRSFWAMPGWTSLSLHPIWYQILLICSALALIGLIILFIRKYRYLSTPPYQARFQALTVLLVAAIVAISVLLAWNTITQTIVYRQGRSIYPVIVPLSIFLILGWRQFIPSDWWKEAFLALSIGFFLFDSMVLFNYIIPFFYSQ
ncbi:MAG: hypothetical protein SVT56_11530, partial [Chloroflexota bacterium]|nr:hypothetical protein [Chloroflexota bacterium]